MRNPSYARIRNTAASPRREKCARCLHKSRRGGSVVAATEAAGLELAAPERLPALGRDGDEAAALGVAALEHEAAAGAAADRASHVPLALTAEAQHQLVAGDEAVVAERDDRAQDLLV